MAISAFTELLRLKLETLLGERGSRADHAVRWRDIETVYANAITRSVSIAGTTPGSASQDYVDAQIAIVDGNLAATDEQVATVAAELSDAASTLASDISDLATAQTSLSAVAAELSDATSTLASDISDLATAQTSLSAAISSAQNDADANATAISGILVRVDDVEDGVTALVGTTDTLSAQIVTLGESIQGFQKETDSLDDVTEGAAVTVSLGAGAVGLTNTLLVEEGATARVTSAIPNGATLVIPAAKAIFLAGQRIRIGVLALQPGTGAATRFGACYTAGASGDSGYMQAEEDLTTAANWFSWIYDVPFQTTAQDHYLSIFGDDTKAGLGTLIARVYVEIDAISGNLPDVTVLQGQMSEVRGLELDSLAGTALGTLLTQLDVDVDGTSAAFSAQASAIADIEGNAAASYVLRLSAGGAEAGLEIVVADNPIDGPASALRIDADNIILDGTVIAPHIAAGAVTATKISVIDLSAISANLGSIAVGTANIANGAITTAKIGDAEITSAKIGSLQVESANIANLTVGTEKITAGAVTSGVIDSTEVEGNTTKTLALTCYGGAPVAIWVNGLISGDDVSGSGASITVKWNGVTIASKSVGRQASAVVVLNVAAVSVAGANSLQIVLAKNKGADRAYFYSATALELKK